MARREKAARGVEAARQERDTRQKRTTTLQSVARRERTDRR